MKATNIKIVLFLMGTIFLISCSCDQRFIMGLPCKTDINGWEEGSAEYKQDKLTWKADLDAGRITYTQYKKNLGY